MDFDISKIKQFTINNTPFVVHDFVLKKTAVFNVLFDESVNTEGVINIDIPGATVKDLQIIFALLYGNPHTKLFTNFKINDVVNILKSMTFIGLDLDLIKTCVSEMLNNYTTIIEDLVNMDTYHDCMNIIIDCYKSTDNKKNIPAVVDTLKKNNFPQTFKIKIITKLICAECKPEDFDFVLCVTHQYVCDNKQLSDILHIAGDRPTKKSWFSPAKPLYKEYLNADVKNYLEYSSNKFGINYIKINDKKIELLQHEKTFTTGTMGGNTLMSIATHIAKILLEFDTL